MTRMDKQMEKFQRKCRAFFDGLWPAEEKVLVFGEGQCDHPPVMLVGEAPGEQETLQGRPFVGKAGKNLDGFLQAVRLNREDIYISNVVKVRPTKVSAKGTVSNRAPSREELALFTPYLMEEILLVQPRMLVTLGNTALRALMGPGVSIGETHGQLAMAQVSLEERQQAFPLFALYHPASIIYNRALQAVYEADLSALRQVLEQPAASFDN